MKAVETHGAEREDGSADGGGGERATVEVHEGVAEVVEDWEGMPTGCGGGVAEHGGFDLEFGEGG